MYAARRLWTSSMPASRRDLAGPLRVPPFQNEAVWKQSSLRERGKLAFATNYYYCFIKAITLGGLCRRKDGVGMGGTRKS